MTQKRLKLTCLVYTCPDCGRDTTSIIDEEAQEWKGYIPRYWKIECPHCESDKKHGERLELEREEREKRLRKLEREELNIEK